MEIFFSTEMIVRLEEPDGKMAATEGRKAASQQPTSCPNISSLRAVVTGAGFDATARTDSDTGVDAGCIF